MSLRGVREAANAQMRSDVGNAQLYYICPHCGRPSPTDEHACKCGYRLSDMLPAYRLCPDCNRFVPQSQVRCECGHSFPAEEQLLHVCPACGSVLPMDQKVCDCGYQFYLKASPAPSQPIPIGEEASSSPPSTAQTLEAGSVKESKHTPAKVLIWLLCIMIYGFIVVFFPSTEITELSMSEGLFPYVLEMALLILTCFVAFNLCKLLDSSGGNIGALPSSARDSHKPRRKLFRAPHFVLFILAFLSAIFLGLRGTFFSVATVFVQPFQTVEYIGQAVERIGHSDAGDLSSWRPYNPYAMSLTIFVNTVRSTLRENIMAVFTRDPTASSWETPSPSTPLIQATTPALTPEPTSALTKQGRPINGYILRGSSLNRLAPLTVNTDEGADYFISLCKPGSSRATMTFFVRGGEKAEVTVPLGIFEVYYASGWTWYGTKDLFGPGTLYTKCDGTFDFSEADGGYNGWTLTLYPVDNGNMDSEPVSESEFPA